MPCIQFQASEVKQPKDFQHFLFRRDRKLTFIVFLIFGKMQTALVLENGQKMPIIGYGMWQSNNAKELEDALEIALEVGYRHFDTAQLYLNEDILGRVIQQWFKSGKVKREDLFIVTKLPPQGVHHDRVASFLQDSLDKLKLSYVDLFLIHEPASLEVADDGKSVKRDANWRVTPDLSTSHEQIWRAMEAQVDAGKTKAIGLSSFSVEQVERIVKFAKIKPANIQVELNAHYPKKELRQVCAKHGITVCAFAAFGSPGRKSYYVDKKLMSQNDADSKIKVPALLDNPVVAQIAKKHNKTTGQVLLRFLAQQGVVVLAKSVNWARIKSNFKIFDFVLDKEDMKKLDALDSGKEGSWAFDWKNAFPGIEDHPEFSLKDD